MKKTVIIISLFATLLFTRLFLINKKENITLYITLINSISLIIVFVSILEHAFYLIKDEINKRKVPLQLKNNMIKDVRVKKVCMYLLILPVFIGIKLSSDEYNDALSILAIAISLIDKDVSNIFKEIIRKWCRL